MRVVSVCVSNCVLWKWELWFVCVAVRLCALGSGFFFYSTRLGFQIGLDWTQFDHNPIGFHYFHPIGFSFQFYIVFNIKLNYLTCPVVSTQINIICVFDCTVFIYFVLNINFVIHLNVCSILPEGRLANQSYKILWLTNMLQIMFSCIIISNYQIIKQYSIIPNRKF